MIPDSFCIEWLKQAVRCGMASRPSTLWRIDNIDCVPLSNEHFGPFFSAIGS